MKFEFKGVVYKIWFQYTITGRRRETVCLIDIEGEEANFAFGSTQCSVKDRFNKQVGREVALKRALQYAVKEKGMTDEFWKAANKCYLNRATVAQSAVATTLGINILNGTPA